MEYKKGEGSVNVITPSIMIQLDYKYNYNYDMDNCISCANVVRPRQQAMQRDSCHRWQHRTWGTGISMQQYRKAVNNGGTIDISKFHLPPRMKFSNLSPEILVEWIAPLFSTERSIAKFSLCVRLKNACYSRLIIE